MRSFLNWLALAPILVIVLIFAVVNRRPVVVTFDPFGQATSGLSITAPLFVHLFAAASIGVLLGGAATWIGQGRHRRASREARAEAARLHLENDRLRAPIMPLSLENRPAA